MKHLLIILTIIFGSITTASACGGWLQAECKNKADINVSESLEKLVSQGNRTVGMPSIVNFFEKQMVRQLYEMRDDPTYRTFTYIVNLNGEFIFICDSIGYGINASIQYSNPQKTISAGKYTENGYMAAPQAEPNGLFMPEGLAATYVMCLDPTTLDKPQPKLVPIYVEPDVIVSPFKLK